MARFCLWILALWNSDHVATEASDLMTPAGWTGNPWGPEATRARVSGQLPPLPNDARMTQWRRWGRRVLGDGDIVCRLGDARVARGLFPLSRFIAKATRSPFSHTGVVALEDGAPVVYDCSWVGVRRQPFEVWMLDCVGPFGVKRLRREHRGHVPGVLSYCRRKYEQQVPFDYAFRPDDAAFYCLELTEKAFRSQGLALSQPVRIGDWEDLKSYPLTAFVFVFCSRTVLDRPITLELPVYLPGNESHGIWSSPLLDTVVGPEPKTDPVTVPRMSDGFCLHGDAELLAFVAGELRRSYKELPLGWLSARISHVWHRRDSVHARTRPPLPRDGPPSPAVTIRLRSSSSVALDPEKSRDRRENRVARVRLPGVIRLPDARNNAGR
jgi:hypothetical protein